MSSAANYCCCLDGLYNLMAFWVTHFFKSRHYAILLAVGCSKIFFGSSRLSFC